MKRTAVSETDPTTNAKISYEGVSLNDLVPDALTRYRFEVTEGQFLGLFHRHAVSSGDLSLTSEIVVADTKNGKRMTGYTPFFFVAKRKNGDVVVVRRLISIRLERIEPTMAHSKGP